MSRIAESELIITKRGAIYHLDCRPEEIANTIITVGDPDRVKEVSKHFDKIEYQNQHREFITHTGYIGKKRISCLSTGIGPDNIDIAVNELDALVNIDFESRTIKPSLTALRLIRLGTSGALQANIPVDSFVAGTHGLGFDNVMHFYVKQNTAAEQELIDAFKQHTRLTEGNVLPYVFRGSDSLRAVVVADVPGAGARVVTHQRLEMRRAGPDRGAAPGGGSGTSSGAGSSLTTSRLAAAPPRWTRCVARTKSAGFAR